MSSSKLIATIGPTMVLSYILVQCRLMTTLTYIFSDNIHHVKNEKLYKKKQWGIIKIKRPERVKKYNILSAAEIASADALRAVVRLSLVTCV